MRAVFLSLFILAFSIVSVAQEKNNSRPTQQQILAQKQEALVKAKKQREVTRQKLADAKANNEDPEKIKHMEDMLATMDQMIAMLEKTDLTNNKTPKTLPAPENKEPAYVSPFTPIKLSKPVKAPSWSEAKDKLLWYSGRMIDANTLITASGLVVRYDPRRSTITLQPPRSEPNPDTMYYGLVNMLNQIKPMKNDYSVRMESMLNSFFMFPEIENGYKEYNHFKETFYELAKNTIPLKQSSLTGSLESMIQTLANFIQTLPPVKIIPPPKRPNNLCLCDNPLAKAKYHTDIDAWSEEFYSEEDKINEMLMGIHDRIQSIRHLSGVMPSVPASIIDPVEYYDIILSRMKEKLSELSKKYEQGDALIEDGLAKASIRLHRMQRILDAKRLPELRITRMAIDNLILKIQDLIASNIFEKYIEQQKAAANFNSVFDYGLYLSHELNKKLFVITENVNQNFFETWMEGLKKFNRFELEVELDFHYQLATETGQTSMWANGLLKSEGEIYVSLGRKDCHWELFLSNVDHTNRETSGEEFKIPMKVVRGEKDYPNDNKPPFRYSGPGLKMVFPGFNIDFCGGESKVKMDVASYSPDDAKTHENDDPKAMYTKDILAYVNKMLLGITKTEMNITQLMGTADKMMNINSLLTPQSSGDPALDQLRMLYLMNKKKNELQFELSQVSHTSKTVIKLLPGAGSYLFYPTYDVADPNDEDRNKGIMMTKAEVKIFITHSPQ